MVVSTSDRNKFLDKIGQPTSAVKRQRNVQTIESEDGISCPITFDSQAQKPVPQPSASIESMRIEENDLKCYLQTLFKNLGKNSTTQFSKEFLTKFNEYKEKHGQTILGKLIFRDGSQ